MTNKKIKLKDATRIVSLSLATAIIISSFIVGGKTKQERKMFQLDLTLKMIRFKAVTDYTPTFDTSGYDKTDFKINVFYEKKFC